MSFVTSLSQNHLLREISYWVLLAKIRSQMNQNATCGITRGISLNPDLLLWIKLPKDWCFSKRLSQLSKRLTSIGG